MDKHDFMNILSGAFIEPEEEHHVFNGIKYYQLKLSLPPNKVRRIFLPSKQEQEEMMNVIKETTG
jgi:hypothetical protein